MTRIQIIGFCLFLLSPSAFANKTIVEGVAASNNTMFVDTTNARVDISTNASGGNSSGIPNLGLYVTKNVQVTNNAGNTGCVIFSSATLTCGAISFGGSIGGFWTSSGSNISNNNSGNVGIGTSSPGSKLDVNGNINMGTNSTLSNTAGILIIQPSSDLYLRPTNAPTHINDSNSFNVDIAAGGGNVGINKSSPKALLHIGSNGAATPTYDFNTDSEGLLFNYGDNSGARYADIVAIGNTPAGATQSMRFWTNSGGSPGTATQRMQIDNNGVGIGKAAGSALDVNGTIRQSNVLNCANGVTTDANGGFTGCAPASSNNTWVFVSSQDVISVATVTFSNITSSETFRLEYIAVATATYDMALVFGGDTTLVTDIANTFMATGLGFTGGSIANGRRCQLDSASATQTSAGSSLTGECILRTPSYGNANTTMNARCNSYADSNTNSSVSYVISACKYHGATAPTSINIIMTQAGGATTSAATANNMIHGHFELWKTSSVYP